MKNEKKNSSPNHQNFQKSINFDKFLTIFHKIFKRNNFITLTNNFFKKNY